MSPKKSDSRPGANRTASKSLTLTNNASVSHRTDNAAATRGCCSVRRYRAGQPKPIVHDPETRRAIIRAAARWGLFAWEIAILTGDDLSLAELAEIRRPA